MTLGERLLWAAGIVLVDLVIFALPLTALFLAYVLFARPAWFREWVLAAYSD